MSEVLQEGVYKCGAYSEFPGKRPSITIEDPNDPGNAINDAEVEIRICKSLGYGFRCTPNRCGINHLRNILAGRIIE